MSFRKEKGHKIYERPSHAECDSVRSLGGEAHHEWHPTRAKCGKCATATWPATNVQAREHCVVHFEFSESQYERKKLK